MCLIFVRTDERSVLRNLISDDISVVSIILWYGFKEEGEEKKLTSECFSQKHAPTIGCDLEQQNDVVCLLRFLLGIVDILGRFISDISQMQSPHQILLYGF